MQKLDIPRKTVYRLSLYYRALQRLKQNAIETVSSAALAKAAGVKPTQLRKDLTYFGQFGTRGLGYSVGALSAKLTAVLGTTHLQPVILVGAGNLGVKVLPMAKLHDFVRQQKIKMAILTVPGQVAQEVTNSVVEAGILAILN